jgi:CheY-like chemotaxis protein
MSDNANILIVDDELGPRESLKMILNPSYNTLTAPNGNIALNLIKQYPVDLVTLDLKMPGMNGIEVLKEIQKLNPDIEIIVITGYGTLKTAIECIRLGVFDYINKPFNVPDVISVINKSLTKRKFNSRLKVLFNDIDQISLNASLQEFKEKYNDKETIFNEGSGGNWIYLILKGKVEISKMVDGKKVIIDQLNEGDIFGEMAFFSDVGRSASAAAKVDITATATEPVELGIIDVEAFQKLLSKTPSEIKKIIKILVSRLIVTTNRLTKVVVDLNNLQTTLKR